MPESLRVELYLEAKGNAQARMQQTTQAMKALGEHMQLALQLVGSPAKQDFVGLEVTRLIGQAISGQVPESSFEVSTETPQERLEVRGQAIVEQSQPAQSTLPAQSPQPSEGTALVSHPQSPAGRDDQATLATASVGELLGRFGSVMTVMRTFISIKQFFNPLGYEEALNALSKQLDLNEKKLEEKIKEVAEESGLTEEEVLDSAVAAQKRGADGDFIMKNLPRMAQVQQGTGVNSDTAGMVTTRLEKQGLNAEERQKILDQVAKANKDQLIYGNIDNLLVTLVNTMAVLREAGLTHKQISSDALGLLLTLSGRGGQYFEGLKILKEQLDKQGIKQKAEQEAKQGTESSTTGEEILQNVPKDRQALTPEKRESLQSKAEGQLAQSAQEEGDKHKGFWNWLWDQFSNNEEEQQEQREREQQRQINMLDQRVSRLESLSGRVKKLEEHCKTLETRVTTQGEQGEKMQRRLRRVASQTGDMVAKNREADKRGFPGEILPKSSVGGLS